MLHVPHNLSQLEGRKWSLQRVTGQENIRGYGQTKTRGWGYSSGIFSCIWFFLVFPIFPDFSLAYCLSSWLLATKS